MTDTLHTAGPWRVGDAGATVFGPPNGNPVPAAIASVRRKADARLIAAAPDMAQALTKLLCRWGDYTHLIEQAKGENPEYIEQAKAYGREAEAALARALKGGAR